MYGCSLNADVFWEIGWAALRIYGVDHKQEYNKEWNWAISNFYYFIVTIQKVPFTKCQNIHIH